MGHTIFMLATSGGGLGHLSRTLAVAKCMRRMEPGVEIILVTSSPALELIRKEGFFFNYIPSRRGTSKNVLDVEWMQLMENLFRDMVAVYKPKAVIYDSVYPYGEIRRVLNECGLKKTVWLKRECYKKGLGLIDELEEEFGLVITPKEFKEDTAADTKRKRYVDPIVNITKKEMYEPFRVRQQFHVLPQEVLVYVQLGIGISHEREEIARQVIRELENREGVKLLLGEYMGQFIKGSSKEEIIPLKEYPASKYFAGIDLAISAAGYNTFHELLGAHVPTLFIPNKETLVDDQSKRARMARERKYALSFSEGQTIKEQVDCLFERREELRESLSSYEWADGASQAAKCIMEYVNRISL